MIETWYRINLSDPKVQKQVETEYLRLKADAEIERRLNALVKNDSDDNKQPSLSQATQGDNQLATKVPEGSKELAKEGAEMLKQFKGLSDNNTQTKQDEQGSDKTIKIVPLKKL
jgi:uncharacterized protein (DUF2147 family)